MNKNIILKTALLTCVLLIADSLDAAGAGEIVIDEALNIISRIRSSNRYAQIRI